MIVGSFLQSNQALFRLVDVVIRLVQSASFRRVYMSYIPDANNSFNYLGSMLSTALGLFGLMSVSLSSLYYVAHSRQLIPSTYVAVYTNDENVLS